MSDNHRPHKFPPAALEADWVIAWVCQACGETIREFGPIVRTECPVDWRALKVP